VDWIWKSTLILAGTALVNLALRRHSAALRHHVWLVAFVLLAATPFLERLTPVPTANLVITSAASVSATATQGSHVDWLFRLWLAGAALLLARLFAAHWRAARLTRVDSPALCGLWRPRIVWPEGADEWDEARRTAVVQHETAHLSRGDAWAQLLMEIVAACYWWQPLVWWSKRKALEERERACDDRVLEAGASPHDYALTLLAIARDSTVTPRAALGTVQLLERRLTAMLKPGLDRSRVGLRRGFVLTAGLALVFGGLGLLRADEEVQKVGGDVQAPRLLHKVEPEYSEAAKDAKIAGTVELFVKINTKGRVSSAEVKQSLHPDLDANAVAAVKQWTFQPGMRKGKPVAVAATIEVNFKTY
jgi:TonB family protein